MSKNFGVCCDVKNCRFNESGFNCRLEKIRVTAVCGENCTACGSFEEGNGAI